MAIIKEYYDGLIIDSDILKVYKSNEDLFN